MAERRPVRCHTVDQIQTSKPAARRLTAAAIIDWSIGSRRCRWPTSAVRTLSSMCKAMRRPRLSSTRPSSASSLGWSVSTRLPTGCRRAERRRNGRTVTSFPPRRLPVEVQSSAGCVCRRGTASARTATEEAATTRRTAEWRRRPRALYCWQLDSARMWPSRQCLVHLRVASPASCIYCDDSGTRSLPVQTV